MRNRAGSRQHRRQRAIDTLQVRQPARDRLAHGDEAVDHPAHLVSQGVDVTCLEARGINHGFITMRRAIPSGQQDLKRVYRALAAMLA